MGAMEQMWTEVVNRGWKLRWTVNRRSYRCQGRNNFTRYLSEQCVPRKHRWASCYAIFGFGLITVSLLRVYYIATH